MLKFDRQGLRSKVIAMLDLTSGLLILFTKKCQMLNCDVVMKVTNENKDIFHFIHII